MGESRRDRVEWLTTGRSARRRWMPVWVAALAAVPVAVVLVLSWPEGSSPPSGAPEQPAPRTSPTPIGGTADVRRVTVRRFDARVLGGSSGWELYGRGATTVVRVRPAAQTVTLTPVPELDSTGPVSFLVTGATAVIRPLDAVPGYQVGDGGEVRRLRPPLTSGPVLPGPEPGQVWAVDFEPGSTLLSLVRLRGPGWIRSVVVAGHLYGALAADGTGWFAYPLDGATFAYRDGRTHRVADGLLVAAGPRTWVIADCRQARCRPTVLNRRTGQARRLRTPVENLWMSGSVSPDGRYAALRQTTGSGVAAQILDLTTGDIEKLGIGLSEAYDLSDLVWTPDSRLLLVLDRGGRLWAVDPRGQVARRIGLGLPPLQQLAIAP